MIDNEKTVSELTDEEVLQRMLDVEAVPERTVALKRIGIPVTIKGLTGKQVFSVRERCTVTLSGKRGQTRRELDEEAFNGALIAAATVKPAWGDPKLLAKYRASSAEEVIKRLLLAGEIAQLGDLVLEISEFNTELEEVKN